MNIEELKRNSRARMQQLLQDKLLEACKRDDLAAAQAALDQGADPRGMGAATAMRHAVYQGKVDMLKFLAAAGADLNALHPENGTPLLVTAIRAGARTAGEAVPLLLQLGADPNVVWGHGWSVLHWAARDSPGRVISSLVHSGANLETKDDDGRTPLLVAAVEGKLDCTRLLLVLGADPSTKASDGRGLKELAPKKLRAKMTMAVTDEERITVLAGLESITEVAAPLVGDLTEQDVSELYTYYAGSFFEGVWMGLPEIDKALFSWAYEKFPVHVETAGKSAYSLECVLRDEEGPQVIADFLNALSPALWQAALGAIRDEFARWKEEEAAEWVTRLENFMERKTARTAS